MSQENVEIVQRGYERFNDGNIEGFLDLCGPEFEFRDLPDLPASGVFVGHSAIRGWWTQLFDAFDGLRFEAEEFIDAGDRSWCRPMGPVVARAVALWSRFTSPMSGR